jgi:hypothetical protein
VASWSFLTSHAGALLCIAHDPGARLRDIAASVGITERSAYGIVTDLTAVGYARGGARPAAPLKYAPQKTKKRQAQHGAEPL